MITQLDTPLEPITMRGRVAKLIRDAILAGKFQPGERIVEYQLCKRLGVGTTSIREALFELESQGFVKRVTNRGASVTELSASDIEQIYRMRKDLEALAAELLLERIDQVDLSLLEEPLASMKVAAHAMDVTGFYENDLSFHRTLWRLSENRYLASCLEQLVVPLFAFSIMRTPRDSREELLDSVDQHYRILDAIKTRDTAQARETIQEVLSLFREQDSRVVGS